MRKLNKKIMFISGMAIIVAILMLMMTHKEKLPKIITAEDEMPDFKFQLITGGTVQRADMDTEKFTLMWFFNSECDYCISEAQALVDSISLLSNCQIVMVSHEDSIKIAGFNERFRLTDLPSVNVAYVPEDYVKNMFKIYVVPTLYVYHQDKYMLKYKPGPVTIHTIVQYLKNNI